MQALFTSALAAVGAADRERHLRALRAKLARRGCEYALSALRCMPLDHPLDWDRIHGELWLHG